MKLGFLFAMNEEAAPVAEKLGFSGELRPGEVNTLPNGDKIAVSGIGRANAAIAAIRLFDAGCDAIVNIGTCGSTYPKTIGKIVLPTVFRDGDFTFQSDNYLMYDGARLNPAKIDPKAVRIFTVSHFSTEPLDKDPYLVDMESYAIVTVCKAKNAKFLLLKVVSDGADEDAELTFEENVTRVIRANAGELLSRAEAFRKGL